MKSDRHLITFGPATVPAGDVLVHDPQGDELLARDGLQAAPDDGGNLPAGSPLPEGTQIDELR